MFYFALFMLNESYNYICKGGKSAPVGYKDLYCKILYLGPGQKLLSTKNQILVEFENGVKVLINKNAIQKRQDLQTDKYQLSFKFKT